MCVCVCYELLSTTSVVLPESDPSAFKPIYKFQMVQTDGYVCVFMYMYMYVHGVHVYICIILYIFVHLIYICQYPQYILYVLEWLMIP